jgi:hypothetical protein
MSAVTKMSPSQAASNILRELRTCHDRPTIADARVMLDTFFDFCGVRYGVGEVAEIERLVLAGFVAQEALAQ